MKTFTEINTPDDNVIMIVDAMNIAFRYAHAKKREFLEDYVGMVESLAKSYKASKIIMACDQGSSSYRKEILPTYKAGRKEKFELQTDEERKYFELFFKEFNRVMNYFDTETSIPLLRFDKCEADDIAAYLVKRLGKVRDIWLIRDRKSVV